MPNLIERLNEEGEVIWRINTKTKNGYYKVNPDSSQYKYCERITLKGFTSLPSGLWKEGYGMTAAGSFLLQEIFEKYGKKIDITLVASGSSKLDARGKKTKVILPIKKLAKANQAVRATKRKRNEEIRANVKNFLSSEFTQFKEYKGIKPSYAAGTLAELLEQPDIIKKLGAEDIDKLHEFIPDYLSKIPGTLRAKKKLAVVYESLDAGRKVYLEKIVEEFRKKLNAGGTSESTWQKFLSEYILVLRNSYGEVLEKESVSLSGKYPDFMLIDPYSYLDIFEIKKPATNILKYDNSRNNYYWDTELSKAISQVENYLYQVQRNSSALVEDIKKHKGLDISIVRPRGYIVAGVRTQLTKTKMADDFRILNDSLKNIDVIFYDDLLNNLETFVKRISECNS